MESYSGILKEKAESGEGECKLTVDIPAFKSKYPTILTRVPAGDAGVLEVGMAYTWLLERGNLKQDKKEGSTRLYDYWWNYRGIGASPPVTAETRPAPQTDGLRRDATGRSIERQVALKAAVEYAGYRIQGGMDVDPDTLLKAAEVFDRWLAKGPQASQEPRRGPSTPAAGAEPPEEAEGPF